GQTDRAAELFQQALQERPDSPTIRYHLALALGKQGDKGRALETLRKALDGGPFPEAEAAKSELARLEAQEESLCRRGSFDAPPPRPSSSCSWSRSALAPRRRRSSSAIWIARRSTTPRTRRPRRCSSCAARSSSTRRTRR